MTSSPGTWSLFPRNRSPAAAAQLVAHLLRTAAAAGPACVLLVAGFARRWVDDDGFINLRVVRNLLHGAGPVYNPGERVEAVTSPLWVGLLAVLGALGVRLEYAAAFGGIALAAAGVLLVQRGATRLNGGSVAAGDRAKAVFLPVGAATFVVLPPAWDYASSGLETGLSLAWLGASFLVTAAHVAPGGRRAGGRWTVLADAALIGAGPLIRPELVIHALVPLVVVGRSAALQASRRPWPMVAALTRVAACAAAMPASYQVFRMGYYAAIGPNTAIAKEAFLANWPQGACYFDNFFRTYALGWPLGAAALFWLVCLHAHAACRRWAAFAVTLAAPLAAAAHALYVVRVGGDYMHGRMLLVPASPRSGRWPRCPFPRGARPRGSSRDWLSGRWASGSRSAPFA
jgi:arabinofuranosyltransferase